VDNGVVVLFMLLGAVLVVFARPFTASNLRPFVSKEQLAERNQPNHRRVRRFYRVGVAMHIVVGLCFFVSGVVILVK